MDKRERLENALWGAWLDGWDAAMQSLQDISDDMGTPYAPILQRALKILEEMRPQKDPRSALP
jgi:hypothetical protein